MPLRNGVATPRDSVCNGVANGNWHGCNAIYTVWTHISLDQKASVKNRTYNKRRTNENDVASAREVVEEDNDDVGKHGKLRSVRDLPNLYDTKMKIAKPITFVSGVPSLR